MQKIKFLLLSAAFLFPLFSTAQVHFGIKAGPNISFFNSNGSYDELFFDETTALPILNYHVGLMIDFRLGEDNSIQADMLYQVKGGKRKSSIATFVNGQETSLESNFSRRTSFISIPLTYHYRVGYGLKVLAGAQISYTLETGFKVNDGNWVKADARFLNDARTDFGGLVGIGYELAPLVFELRYSHSFTKFGNITVTDMNGQPIGTSFDRHRAVQLSVGYVF